jgi:hypothetical protein
MPAGASVSHPSNFYALFFPQRAFFPFPDPGPCSASPRLQTEKFTKPSRQLCAKAGVSRSSAEP